MPTTYEKVASAFYSAIARDKEAKTKNLGYVIETRDDQNPDNRNLTITNSSWLMTFVPTNAYILNPGERGYTSYYVNDAFQQQPSAPIRFPNTGVILRDAIDRADSKFTHKPMDPELVCKVLGVFKKLGCKTVHENGDDFVNHPVLYYAEVPSGRYSEGTLYALVMPRKEL